MKIIKKIINIVWVFLMLLCIPCVHAVTVRTPWDDTVVNEDVPRGQQIEWKYSVFDIISFINSYLWLAIWLICFIVIIRNWIKLIIARGDSKEMKSATNALIWCAIGLLVCILSYIIVNLALKLFA